MRIILSFFAFLLAFGAPAFAADQVPHHTTARLEAAGNTAALSITIEKGWKTYWRTPGEAGLPPVFDWTGSENLKSATVHWPAPKRYTADDLENYVYQDGVVFPFDVEARDPGKPVKLKLRLDILVCSKICLPETWALAADVAAGGPLPAYAAALKHEPRRDDGVFRTAYLNFDSSNNTYLVVVAKANTAPTRGADLFVENAAGLGFGRPKVSREGGVIVFAAPVHSDEPLDKISARLSPHPLTLTWTDGVGGAVEGTLPLSPRPAAASEVPQSHEAAAVVVKTFTGLEIALFAFLGGLILNLMPCVLPVLSLKVLSVLSHGGKEGKRRIFDNFTASGLGILASFWLMAGSLALLKGAGDMIGWGIQFQNPLFLIFLIAVVLVFAASMWGFFDIPLPRFIAKNIPARHEHEPTLLGHFLTGAFATLLATPCTAPFLGTAVGFGLSGSAGDIFAVFTMIGLGLAAPYFLLAVSPGLFRFLPKPGAWMVTLKKVLSLALVLTAAWLASVLVTISTTPALDDGWETFSEARIAPAVKEGKVVVIDVTADWCLTCKANKRLVLDNPEIIEALSGPEIVRLQADWTQRDEKISAYLQKNGRYGIPFNIIYGPGRPEGVPLPELLSKKAVLDALAEAAGE